MSLLPSKPDTSAADEPAPQVVGVDSDRADDLLSALSSTTAREILTALHEDPAPPSALADRVDTSLQNTQYHIENLENAGAVEVIDTVYSEKGREMDVYAPADRPLVIFAGEEGQSRGLRAALSDLLGGIVAIALGALVVQEAFGRSVVARLFRSLAGGTGDAGGGAAPPATSGDDGAAATATPTPTGEPTATPAPEEGVDGFTSEDVTTTAAEMTDGGATATPAATSTPTPAADSTGAATSTPAATSTATPTPTEVATEAARTATETVAGGGGSGFDIGALPPGVLFFMGGLLALLVVVTLAYTR